MKTFLTPLQYNEIYSTHTDIIINPNMNEEVTRLKIICDNQKVVIAINQKIASDMRELLNDVISDDSSRYNRPSYYYKIKKYIEEEG
jgi:hypothetical protein